MSNLGEVVRRLADREGVEAVLLLSEDGLPIQQAGRGALEADAAAALAATFAQYAGRLGDGVGRGGLRTAVLEYDRGLVVLARLGMANWLAVLAAREADVGELLYALRRHRPALAALL